MINCNLSGQKGSAVDPPLTCNRSLNLLLINTNGLHNRPVFRMEGDTRVKVGNKDKVSLLHSMAAEHNVDVAGLVETHGYNVKAKMFNLAPHQSTNQGRSGGWPQSSSIRLLQRLMSAAELTGSPPRSHPQESLLATNITLSMARTEATLSWSLRRTSRQTVLAPKRW